MGDPLLDLVIAVHTPTRPIRRAVESATAGMTADQLRVTVVCHGLPAEDIQAVLGDADPGLVRLVEYRDGIPSPAGPFNEGLRRATGKYVAIMGSDDFFEPGCLTMLLAHAEAEDADVVLARLRHQGGDILRNPLPRFRRSVRLDPASDRLFYRSAPLGLLRRDIVEREGLRMTETLTVGEDLAFSSTLWSVARRIDFPRGVPAYVIGADATDRVTAPLRPITELMAPVLDLIERDRIRLLAPRIRRSLVVKIFRIQILGAVAARRQPSDWTEVDVDALAATMARLLRFARGALRPFSRSDRIVLDAIARSGVRVDDIVGAGRSRANASRWASVLPRNPLRVLDREGTMIRYLLYRIDRDRPGA